MEVPSFKLLKFDSQQSLQKQLHQQLLEWICSGQYPPKTKLPSSRHLAKELGISRNTITLTFDQLKSEGFLESYPGKGIFVPTSLPFDVKKIDKIAWEPKESSPALSNFGQALEKLPLTEHSNPLPFTPGIPDVTGFPLKIWNSLQRRHHDRLSLLAYDGNQGLLALRKALAEYLRLSRGVRCTEEQVVITHGAQQAISLCAQVIINEGDQVLVENPGYLGARKAFMARGANLSGCSLNDNGLNIDELINRTANTSSTIKLMYCTPTHQYPLGGILPAAERIRLLDWAAGNRTWIIEDDYDSEFHFYNHPIAALQGMAEDTPVIYMGSFSKTLFPALRMGYLVLPHHLVPTFVKAKSYMSGESPLLPQAVIADFINEGHFVRHLRRMRKLYHEKWLHLRELIDQKLSHQVNPIAKSAGMHLAIEIPGVDDKALSQALKAKGYGSSAMSSYYLCNTHQTGLVLGFANTNKSQREALTDVLHKELKESNG